MSTSVVGGDGFANAFAARVGPRDGRRSTRETNDDGRRRRRWWWPVIATAAICCLAAAAADHDVPATWRGGGGGGANRSLAFVFDTTGSMHDDYVQLKTHANDIMTYVLNRDDTDVDHFVFVPFNDPVSGPVLETFKPEEIMRELNKVQVTGGGDCPEMGITAVIHALRATKPNSYIYVFTDASPKDTNLVNEALELIQRKQSQVVVLRTGENCGLSDKSYEQIASLGSGNVFNVDKGDVSKVLEFVKTSMETNQVNLLSMDIAQSQKNPSPKNLSIDESIKNLMVSVTGLNSNIELVDPIGKKINETQGLITELNLKNIKIVNVIEPIPGEWTLYITSESAHTIRAAGVSSMHFNFGFATKKPKYMTQTSHRPLKGAENYVLVNCQEVKKFLSCKIQDLNSGNNTKLLPIINLGENILLCGPFIPDENPFYVQVFGINNNGHYFKRITKTSIIPEEPDTPYITTPNQVIAVIGGELRINCHVESLVPFTATWKGRNYPQSTWNFSQSSEIELLIPNVTAKQDGIYTCGAQNRAGEAESTTNVTLLSKPVIVEGSHNVIVTLYEGDDYSMTCTSKGIPTPKTVWLINNSPISHLNDHICIIEDAMRLIIYDAVFRNSKVYTCKASNDAGTTVKHYNVHVKVKPLENLANESLVMNEFHDAHLRCPIINMDNQWFKDGVNINNLVYQRADEQHFRRLNRELKIYELDASDSAIYTCRSSNESYSIDLQVQVAPEFIELQSEKITVKRNETVVLDCSAKGYPKPKVLWRKTDFPLPVTHWTLEKIRFSNNKQKLIIYSIDWIHNGTFSCTIINNLGNDERNFEILVI